MGTFSPKIFTYDFHSFKTTEMAKTAVTAFTKRCYLTIPFSMCSDTWASTIHCVSIKKLKKLVRQCELRSSLRVSVFTIESVLRLIHLQNTSFMFALHQFGLWRIQPRFCTVSFVVLPPIHGHLKNQILLLSWLQHQGKQEVNLLKMNYSLLLKTLFCF